MRREHRISELVRESTKQTTRHAHKHPHHAKREYLRTQVCSRIHAHARTRTHARTHTQHTKVKQNALLCASTRFFSEGEHFDQFFLDVEARTLCPWILSCGMIPDRLQIRAAPLPRHPLPGRVSTTIDAPLSALSGREHSSA